MSDQNNSAYARAGVSIDTMDEALKRVGRQVKSTHTEGVVPAPGAFGGLFRSPGRDSLLVSSVDGVGTKLKVAAMAGRHDTVGRDLVNHCVNDILTQGARPLFFLDYLGTARLEPGVFNDVIRGFSRACRENGCALLGGETAEMPGLYPEGEYDLVGAIVGAVEKKKRITGRDIRPGDVLIGLPSTGLHTNGYTLARHVIFEQAGRKPDDLLPGTRTTFAEALLRVHRSYLRPVTQLMESVTLRGIAHLTGGGFIDNIPRILPGEVDAVVERGTWRIPPIFEFMAEAGEVSEDEMYRVFNMGIGMVLIVRPEEAEHALTQLREMKAGAKRIGTVESGRGHTRLV
ncbi:phosphoribosylformylglycinamidine cyclo-ligase [Kiritimatiella glycovorans]|uniref:Phosphoribosylformylglycinamidine cyclo-ligase n=1 Tax=Kiritimatiella glycovorans TaxID=1307763 RepID=A0A0G3EJM7_9BACT|nr:phosphoribosylformylglycinamidine cyclo-ligase [Kiritimatiella glycovorans]AKJ64329.1 Phosphoribosylformylglycinamidine cyclo-ligase [Kiritimatiella glycovorans]